MKKELFQPLSGNVMPRFGGPATFMRLPACGLADHPDAAFIGVPIRHWDLESARGAACTAPDKGRIKDAAALQHGDPRGAI